MASMRDIRRRIKSVTSTQKITKAMKMVSASKLRRAQNSLTAARPYSDKVQEVMDHILSGGAEYAHPFLRKKDEVKKILYIVIAGDRGLCGGYNSAVLRKAEEVVDNRPEGTDYGLVLVGTRTRDYFHTRPKYQVDDIFTNIGDCPSVGQGKTLSEYVMNKYLSGEYDEVHMVYSEFVTVMTQVPRAAQILPIPVSAADEEAEEQQSEYIFEPQQEAILEVILPKYVDSTIYRYVLEAKAGEHGARMTAMGSATDNAYELIDKLTLSLNRARQAAITTEISEIVGGAAALK